MDSALIRLRHLLPQAGEGRPATPARSRPMTASSSPCPHAVACVASPRRHTVIAARSCPHHCCLPISASPANGRREAATSACPRPMVVPSSPCPHAAVCLALPRRCPVITAPSCPHHCRLPTSPSPANGRREAATSACPRPMVVPSSPCPHAAVCLALPRRCLVITAPSCPHHCRLPTSPSPACGRRWRAAPDEGAPQARGTASRRPRSGAFAPPRTHATMPP